MALPDRITHLLLDLDGTVLDFAESQRHALRDTVVDLGVAWDEQHAVVYSDINVELWESYERREIAAGDLRVTRWRRFLDTIEVTADPDEVGAAYLRRFAAGGHLLDGAAEAVEKLAERYTLVAITNGFGDVQHQRLARAELDPHLAGVVVSDEVGVAKPHAAIFDAAFELAGNPPREHVAIVGDSLTSDMAGGRQYGIMTVWINPAGDDHAPHPAPDLVVERLSDLV